LKLPDLPTTAQAKFNTVYELAQEIRIKLGADASA
jgi:hypothetical protein